MAKSDVQLDESYRVGARDVFLSVTIGEGQFGTSDVFLEKVRIVRASGPIGSLRIGGGPEIAGKTLLVRSVVNDVSSRTNRMSVTYVLRGGRAEQKFTAKGNVAKEGKLLIFEAAFSLDGDVA
jgi:hypothetical protein